MKKLFILIVIIILLTCCACSRTDNTASSEDTIVKTEEFSETEETAEQTIEDAETLILNEDLLKQRKDSEYNELVKGSFVSNDYGMSDGSIKKDNLAEVESCSCIIVLATVVDKEEIDTATPEEKELGLIQETTITTLGIEKVFKNTSGKELGQELVIEEICHIAERSDGDILFTDGYYKPAEEYGTYLFFLESITEASAEFTPTSRWYGKYPVTTNAIEAKKTNSLTCGALELASNNPNSTVPADIKRIFNEIYDKYYSDSTVVSVLEIQEQFAAE